MITILSDFITPSLLKALTIYVPLSSSATEIILVRSEKTPVFIISLPARSKTSTYMFSFDDLLMEILSEAGFGYMLTPGLLKFATLVPIVPFHFTSRIKVLLSVYMVMSTIGAPALLLEMYEYDCVFVFVPVRLIQ